MMQGIKKRRKMPTKKRGMKGATFIPSTPSAPRQPDLSEPTCDKEPYAQMVKPDFSIDPSVVQVMVSPTLMYTRCGPDSPE